MKGNAGFEMQVRDREIDKLREQISKLTDALSKAREDTNALWRERDELKAERDTLKLYHDCTAEKESERERVISRQAKEIARLQEALKEIMEVEYSNGASYGAIAREALKEASHE